MAENTSYIDTTGLPFLTEYQPIKTVQSYQNIMMRFGHSDNLTAVIEDRSASETEDYVLGLIFAGAVIVGFFLLWCLLLMIFMCIGHRVGFLSGAPFVRSSTGEHGKNVYDDGAGGDEDDEARDVFETDQAEPSQRYNAEYGANSSSRSIIYPHTTTGDGAMPMRNGDAWRSKASISRIIFIASGLTCITFGFLLVSLGVTNLQTGVNTVDENVNTLQTYASSAIVVIQQGLRDVTTSAETIRSILLEDMAEDSDFCPADPQLSESRVGRDIKRIKDEVVDFLLDLNDFQDDTLKQIEEAMEVIVDGTTEVNKESDITMTDWEPLIVIIPYTIFPSLLIVAAILAMFDVSSRVYSCFINWFVLPFFVIMTVVAFAFAAAMSIAAGVNSDFCLPGGRSNSSPDEMVLSILESFDYDQSSYAYRVTKFYVSQCFADDPVVEIRQYKPQLDDSTQALTDLAEKLIDASVIDELAVYCNRNYDILTPLVISMSDTLRILQGSVDTLLDIASCGRIIPLYTDTMYKGGCDYAPKAVFWVLCSCLILGFFGMMMITFRSSMKMSVVDNSYAGHFLHTESLSLRHHNKETFDETDIREMDSSSDAVQSPKHPQQPQEENFEDERKEQGTSTVTSNNAS